MKKTVFGFIVCIVLLSSMNVKAQQHNIRFDLTNLVLTELRFHYEYNIDENKSASVMAGMYVPHKIPGFIDNILYNYGAIPYNFDAITKEYGKEVDLFNKMSGYTFGGQFRFYIGDYDYPQGFYINPYVKFHKHAVNISIMDDDVLTGLQYLDLSNEERKHATLQDDGTYLYLFEGIIDGSINRIGAGVGFGYQLLVADVLTIDWTILGLGVEQWNVNYELYDRSENYNPDYKKKGEEIEDGTKDIVFLKDNTHVDVFEDRLKTKITTFVPMPYTSISIGYYF